MTTAVWRCEPRSHGRNKEGGALPGRSPSVAVKSVFKFRKKYSLIYFWNCGCQFLTQKVDPCFSLPSLTQSDQSQCP